MPNLLMIYDAAEPTNIDSKRIVEQFCRNNKIGFRTSLTTKVTESDIKWCDIIWCIRLQSVLGAEIVKVARSNKCVILAMYDDDFFAQRDFKIRRHFQYKAIHSILKNTDYILSGNKILGKKLVENSVNAKYVQLDTTISEKEIKIPDVVNTDIMKIVYYVNDGTTLVFEKIINNVLKKMPKSMIKRLELDLIGVKPNVARENELYKVNFIPKCSLQDFRKILREGKFTFGIAPLDDNEFSRAKYINKFFEFSMAGIPCIYSNVAPYCDKIKDGYDGIVTDNTAEGWIDAIIKMENTEFRKICVTNAQQILKTQYTMNVFEKNMLQNIKELTGYKASHKSVYLRMHIIKIKNKVVCLLEPFYRLYGRYKIEGSRSVMKWIYERYIKG